MTNGNGCPSDQPSDGAAVNSTGQRVVGEFAAAILPVSCAMRVDVVPIFPQTVTMRCLPIRTTAMVQIWASVVTILVHRSATARKVSFPFRNGTLVIIYVARSGQQAPSFGFDGYDLINPAPYVNVSLVPFSCTYNRTANLSCLQPEGSNVLQHGQAPPFNFITGYKMSNFGDGGSSFADDADKSHDTDIFPNVSDSYLLNCCVWYLTLQCYIVYHTSILVNSATPPWSHSMTVAQLTYRRLLV